MYSAVTQKRYRDVSPLVRSAALDGLTVIMLALPEVYVQVRGLALPYPTLPYLTLRCACLAFALMRLRVYWYCPSILAVPQYTGSIFMPSTLAVFCHGLCRLPKHERRKPHPPTFRGLRVTPINHFSQIGRIGSPIFVEL